VYPMLHFHRKFSSGVTAVLWQYVKVLLSKHRLELHDIGGQWNGSGLYLLTASGSFHEMLGGRSHSLEIDLDKL